MAQLGNLRYNKTRLDAEQKDRLTNTKPGIWLLEYAAQEIRDNWKKYLETPPRKKQPSFGEELRQILKEYDHDISLAIGIRTIIDGLSTTKTLVEVAKLIGTRVQEQINWDLLKSSNPNTFAKLFHRSNDVGANRRRVLQKSTMRDKDVPEVNLGNQGRIRLGTIVVLIFKQATELIDFQTVRKGRRTTKMIVPTPKASKWIQESHEYHEWLSPYYMPTLSKPLDWVDPYAGGFGPDIPQLPVIKTWDRAWARQMDPTEMPEVYACLNTLQGTAWEVNKEVRALSRGYWENGGKVAGMPKGSDDPAPPKPEDYETNELAAADWRYDAWYTHRNNYEERSRRYLWGRYVWAAREYEESHFYYVYQCDWRGRVYPSSSVMHPQGHTFGKGLIQFHKGAPIKNEVDANWLRIQGANLWGNDKVPYEDRIQWTLDNETFIRMVAENPEVNTWWEEADKAWEFLAWALDYAKFLEGGFGTISKVPVQMDGTCNGLQVLSLMLRDSRGGKATNCSPSETPQDVYKEVANKLTDTLNAHAQGGGDMAHIAAKWLSFFGDGGVDREFVKRPTMTTPYSVTLYTVIQYAQDWYTGACKKRGYAKFDDLGQKACVWLAKLLWDAIGEVIVAARDLMGWMQECVKIFVKADKAMYWRLPTGFHGRQKYCKTQRRRTQTIWGDTRIQLTHATGSGALSRRRMVNGVAPNIVHSYDAAAMMRTVSICRDQGCDQFQMIHDSYGVPAGHADIMYTALRQAWFEMFQGNVLKDLKDQWETQLGPDYSLPDTPELGDLDPADLFDSPYFFH